MILALALMSGCQGKPAAEGGGASVDSVMKQLSEKADPQGLLTEVDSSEIDSFYFFQEGQVKSQRLKMASDTRADQIAVFEVTDAAEAKAVIADSLAAMKAQNANYFPEEADKLEHACVLTQDDIIAVVVSEDADAICTAGLK